MTGEEKQRTPDGRTVEEIVAKVRAQPETAQIAASLGLELDDYVELVAHYALNPDEPVELQAISDEDAKAAGVPTLQETVGWVEQVASGAIDVTPAEERTRFEDDDIEKDAITLTGAKRVVRAPPSMEQSSPALPAGPRPSRGLKK